MENVNTVHRGTDALPFLNPKIWKLVPLQIKSCQTLEEFKKKIKSWIPENCPCRLCKTYLHQIGFHKLVPFIFAFDQSYFNIQKELN